MQLLVVFSNTIENTGNSLLVRIGTNQNALMRSLRHVVAMNARLKITASAIFVPNFNHSFMTSYLSCFTMKFCNYLLGRVLVFLSSWVFPL